MFESSAFIALSIISVARSHAATETVLYNFKITPGGSQPNGGLARDQAGNYYGTNGAFGGGNVFKVDTSGHETVMYSFSGQDGYTPNGGLTQDAEGNFYGTTDSGGPGDNGVIYKLDTSGNATTVFSFNYQNGASPTGIILDAGGDLYGASKFGGPFGYGNIFKIDASGKETVLYSFTGGADGGYPYSGVIRDSSGNLYGTTYFGGVVYKLSPAGQFTILYTFTGGKDGNISQNALLFDPKGNLYGTTSYGGADNAGVVFKVATSGAGETVLYTFTGGADGNDPDSPVVADAAGNRYGTTATGGASQDGVVFKIDTSGKFSVLYSFTNSEPDLPSGVALDSGGNLYGTTYGNLNGSDPATKWGGLFSLSAAGQETVLYTFHAATGGSNPSAGVTLDAAGNLYGTASGGGVYGQGAAYKLEASGAETTLHDFGGSGGADPLAGVILDGADNICGTTAGGGGAGTQGVVYKLDPAGLETVLHVFSGPLDGSIPHSDLIFDFSGNLYGTTEQGGAFASGIVFKIDSSGVETIVHSFAGGTDGSNPNAGVIKDSEGNLYGTTQHGGAAGLGTVFKIDSSGQETVLYSFMGGTDGSTPLAGLLMDLQGNLYGTTVTGGLNYGTVFKLDASGAETVLYRFSGADGSEPHAGLTSDPAGNLYGTTYYGGQGYGVVFELNTAGQETVLFSFMGGSNGGYPRAGLIRDSAGNLYGTTAQGGNIDGGVVFKIAP